MIVSPESIAFTAPLGFLVLEGVNGAGKTTLQSSIIDHLSAAGRQTVRTREPGSTKLGEQIRAILLSGAERPCPRSELLLFAADRAEHVEKTIRPALAAGSFVISDRYLYSTTAFQGYGRELDLGMVETINRTAIDGLEPDFVILLDLDAAEGLRRSAKRGDAAEDAFEAEALAFHERLRRGFLKIAAESKTPFVVLDATATPGQIFAQLREPLNRWMAGRR